MMKLKDFFRIGRAQTVPATVLLLTVGYLVGGGELFSIYGLTVVLLGMIAHMVAFGHNTVMDSSIIPEMGFGKSVDEADESKQHHPIIKGDVSLKEAHTVFHVLLTLIVSGAGIFALQLPGNPSYALFGLTVWLVFGYAYNNGMSIFSVWKWIFIATSFTGMFYYAYFLQADTLGIIPILVGAYIFVKIHFQTGVEGELKDLDAPENNMLEKLGAKVEEDVVMEDFQGLTFKKADDVFKPGYALYYGLVLTAVQVTLGFTIIELVVLEVSIIQVIVALIAIGLMFVGTFLSVSMLRPRRWDRDKELKKMGLCEIAFIYALVVMLTPIIGYLEGAVLMVFGVLWFFGMNKWLWGTDHPAV